jgi:predicted Zn-dependent protease
VAPGQAPLPARPRLTTRGGDAAWRRFDYAARVTATPNDIQRLIQAGRKDLALVELESVVERAPGGRDARLMLARLANELGRSGLAARHARVLTGRDPRDSEAWSALGTAAFGMGRKRESVGALRRAVEIAPAYASARYNLAAVLASQERSEEALEQASAALARGAKPRGVGLVQARALIQLDRSEEAERGLLALLSADAHDVEALNLLVQLRQLRGDPDPLAPLRAAAQAPSAPPRLRLALADAARRSGALPEAELILRDLLRVAGPDPTLLSSLSTVLQEAGRAAEALDAARASIARLPDDATSAENFVVAALCAGASAEALPVVEKFRALRPRDQRWTTYRIDIARLHDAGEFAGWFDAARVVSVVDLPAPAGFANTAEFHAALLPALQARHREGNHPLDQSLRHGTQTSRNLLMSPGAEIAALLDTFRVALADMQARLGRDPGHPFAARSVSSAEIVGCWSVRLRRGGFHVNHIHPEGWVSSAYYVSVPPEVQDAAQKSGWLAFGAPRFPVPGLAAFAHVQPKPGRLVLFPSYLWHGTHALREDAPRMSVAFDAVPQDELS